ncbi:MAG: flagellar assembly protein H [Richelia sp. CSU_2_1]|nr:flagellar assembly protein H [Microcoleus sp. SU_5_6]NJL67705.1 flagellar assembly protein H [Microcoleus sp. SM1_3_4]NJR22371.1 flagellar assembly protein H [Richelia sp. CSU_2_1]
MTRFIHDQFAKDYLAELLSPLGVVNPNRGVNSEVREVDVYFIPSTVTQDYVEMLGILGKMTATTALFEPFRNPMTVSDFRSCLSKLLDIPAELERQARRDNTRCEEADLPKLWILTPTASETILNGLKASPDEQNWIKGIYFLGEYLRTAIVVIHQLPEIPETLWLRILGRGRVQERAIVQLSNLSIDSPVRAIALELLYRLQSNLAANQEQQLEDRELVMTIAPLFQQQLEAAKQEGKQEGIEQGRAEGQRSILENFLRVRFGELDAILTAFLVPASALPAIEFTLLLLQLSALTVDEQGLEQARRLLAENVWKMRFDRTGDTDEVTRDDRINDLVSNLLALPAEELVLLLQQLPQLSDEELRARLSDSDR